MGYRIEMYSVPASRTKESVLKKWNNGNDFKIVGGPYCSIRDIEQLKKDFDIIELNWIDTDDKVCYHNIYTNVLSGVTTYI